MAKQPKPVTVDFETLRIQGRPLYPPVSVGVAIKYPGKPGRYYAWGHPTNNNCCLSVAQQALEAAWQHPDGVLFQNGKFDLDVAEVHHGLKPPPPSRVHDTLFLLFLDDPHQQELGLKPSAERLLGLKPEEQDAVGDWLMAAQPLQRVGIKLSRAKKSPHYFGGYIAHAPGDLVGKYAIGDVVRTEKLFNLLWPKTKQRLMLDAYQRELDLLPVLLAMERHGVPVDLPRLRRDVRRYQAALGQVDAWLLKKLRRPDLNLDAGAELIEALVAEGLADRELIPLTEKGALKSDKETLATAVTSPVVSAMLRYRTQLATCLRTFMEKWLETAEASGGLIFTSWNQTKSAEGASAIGARTGRLSSHPNFQNTPNEFEPAFKHLTTDAKLRRKLPACPLPNLPPLPFVRDYVIAGPGRKLGGRDYSQQELRILGHFEGQTLMERYQQKPRMDIHEEAQQLINQLLGTNYGRKPIKNTGFGLVYGMGLGKLAMRSKISVDEAKQVRDAYLAIFPGLKDINKDMKERAKANEPIRTWGGREYYCEPPKLVDNRLKTFEYKLINVLVQGSSADCTKQAMINFDRVKHPSTRLLLTVHDELLISAEEPLFDAEMAKLRRAMEELEFDVPMLTDGKVGPRWHHMQELKEGL